MDRCDVLIVGGGPAGSSCAWRLARAGLDVVVLDKSLFPRDKVCAGWITPAVVDTLGLDLDDYRSTRTLQPITGFRTGAFGGEPRITDFAGTISYGIRRCEFDDYLLQRSKARLLVGEPLVDLRREGQGWIANDLVRAPVVVGAGGHFCPVAHQLNGARHDEPVVVAQEMEFPLAEDQAACCGVQPERPELFFWPDLSGYGWCFRKGAFLNVGVGRLTRSHFPAAVRDFASTLAARGAMPSPGRARWKGHAYLLSGQSSRRLSEEGVLIVGDAAGLALAPSGEGILAAVESGLIAAEVILRAGPSYARDRLAAYDQRIRARFGVRPADARYVTRRPNWLVSMAAGAVLHSPWLTRRCLLERWFLHMDRATLA